MSKLEKNVEGSINVSCMPYWAEQIPTMLLKVWDYSVHVTGQNKIQVQHFFNLGWLFNYFLVSSPLYMNIIQLRDKGKSTKVKKFNPEFNFSLTRQKYGDNSNLEQGL